MTDFVQSLKDKQEYKLTKKKTAQALPQKEIPLDVFSRPNVFDLKTYDAQEEKGAFFEQNRLNPIRTPANDQLSAQPQVSNAGNWPTFFDMMTPLIDAFNSVAKGTVAESKIIVGNDVGSISVRKMSKTDIMLQEGLVKLGGAAAKSFSFDSGNPLTQMTMLTEFFNGVSTDKFTKAMVKDDKLNKTVMFEFVPK